MRLEQDQIDLLSYLAASPYREWFFTRKPSPNLATLDSLPEGLVTKRYSSIGETEEKVHVEITAAGRAAVDACRVVQRRGPRGEMSAERSWSSFCSHMARSCSIRARGALAEARAATVAPDYLLCKSVESYATHEARVFALVCEAVAYRESAAGYRRMARDGRERDARDAERARADAVADAQLAALRAAS